MWFHLPLGLVLHRGLAKPLEPNRTLGMFCLLGPRRVFIWAFQLSSRELGPASTYVLRGVKDILLWSWPQVHYVGEDALELLIFLSLASQCHCVICVVRKTEHGASCRLLHHLTNSALVSMADEWFHFIWCAFQILKRAHLFLSLFGESFPLSNLPSLISWPVMGHTGQKPNLDQI